MFNLGYIFLDFEWLLSELSTDPGYQYKNGFVLGDMYMRIFYRTLYNAPVKLKN